MNTKLRRAFIIAIALVLPLVALWTWAGFHMLTCTGASADAVIVALVVPGPNMIALFAAVAWLAPTWREWLALAAGLLTFALYAWAALDFSFSLWTTEQSACAVLMNEPAYGLDGREAIMSAGHASVTTIAIACLLLAVWRRKRMNIKAIVPTS